MLPTFGPLVAQIVGPAALAICLACAWTATGDADQSRSPVAKTVGAHGKVGCLAQPKRVQRLVITRAGSYENYLVDSGWAGGNRVKITADNVTLRNCEIRNAAGNGIGVFANHVTIESCKIHHLLRGTFRDQQDAHGVTGDGHQIVIRNCQIYYVSGDAIQFSPDRRRWNNLLIENCTLATGPLPADVANFRQGERPGENALDSKQASANPRSKVTIRNCLLYGWNQPGQISNMAAINAKENVELLVEECIFHDNEISLRLRGPGRRGGARVTVRHSAIFNSSVGVRMEDNIRDLKIERLGFGAGVARKYHQVGRGPWPGYVNEGEFEAPPLAELLKTGFAK
jgi:hypothetical protein